MKHLWEVNHSYYCNLGNYFARGDDNVEETFESFADFMEEYREYDRDYNLIFRWDWKELNEDGEPNFNGDINYRNGELQIFWMGQRKGFYRYTLVQVCRSDEDAVRAFLQPALQHLIDLWSPLTATLTVE